MRRGTHQRHSRENGFDFALRLRSAQALKALFRQALPEARVFEPTNGFGFPNGNIIDFEMLREAITTWKSNSGNMLLTFALFATGIVCVLWYLDALPNIQLAKPAAPGNSRDVTPRQTTLFVATIVARNPLPQSPVAGIISVYNPSGSIADDGGPIANRTFELTEGSAISILVDNLPTGKFALLVFLDTNKNGILDMNSRGIPSEPYRTINSRDAQPTRSSNLLVGEIELDLASPKHISFTF